MRTLFHFMLCLLGGLLLCAADVAAAAQAIATNRLGEGWWADRHRALLVQLATRPAPQVILIGDSITNNYVKAAPPDEDFQPVWRQFYAPRHALNLGFSGDTTANVLWRLQHGEVAGIAPKVAILLIGTNDTGHAGQDASRTQAGITAVIDDLGRRLPTTKILLLAILPSAISDAKTATDRAVNAYLAGRYAGDPRVTYLDIGTIFLKPDGRLDPSLFYDPRLPQHGKPLHPDTRSQRMMAEAIEPMLARMLGQPRVVPLGVLTAVNSAVIAVPWLERDSYNWDARHQAVLAEAARTRPEIVMIGDSITHFWGGRPYAAQRNGARSWQALFGRRAVRNLGFGWDRTQNVLWRLRQGELDNAAPRWVVMNIGTNNLTGTDKARANTPAEVVAGILAIVKEVRRRTPRSRIVVMGIFPRGADPVSALRRPVVETNRLLAERFGHDPSIRFIDIGERFLTSHGELPRSLMPDGTHPSESGYAIWAAALKDIGLSR